MTRRRALLLMSLLSGCAARGAPPAPAVTTSTTAESTPSSAAPSAAPPAPVVPPTPTLLLTDPKLMAALEARGLTLSELMGGKPASNDELAHLPAFAPVVRELGRELKDVAARDPAAGVDVARFSHRLFDERFLRRREARFALAGVVNRPDRAPFAKESCGEVRLVYRLSYALGEERASKLPMTLGVELTVPREPDGCRAAAKRWVEPTTAGVESRADWLRSTEGPLSTMRLRLEPERARVVLNVQLVRWPSTVRPDLGGHAEYLLSSFRPNQDGVLSVEHLENTPDVDTLRGSSSRRSFEEWLRQNVTAVDEGTALLPSELTATRALSVTPRGLERLANRPFTRVLRGQIPAHEGGRYVKSAMALERRLDQLSCPGCHQARSVAGFHLLGEDSTDAPIENSLALPASPHVIADLPRRLRVARQMLAGEEPDFAAPFAERAGETGRYGDACALGDDRSFAAWTCEAGLVCSAIAARPGEPIGQCLPASPEVGDACERGSVSPSESRLRDRMSRVEEQSCGARVCNRSQVGFPGGMCTGACGDPGASCGAIAILEPFNACLARGESFIACIRGNVRPAGLRACSADRACRDDYVCARGRGAEAGAGVCLPPYFVFQLRVDGHSSRP